MTEATITRTAVAAAIFVAFASLPPLGQPVEGGVFVGITTLPDGSHVAVVLLADKPDKRLTWKDATAWAESVGGQLPPRPVASLLYANAKSEFEEAWYWTNETHQDDASFAWFCNFSYGLVDNRRKSSEGRARAVRLIPVRA